ncbi:hypothetical protein FJT64_010453 [Amphibalanus amphitrite]|uniref:Uncharacterized protein n=1 Tax=Amphibalanus amphitrite TaxID=1232801 RepID=A0A6A4VIM0_AMPAM|nr:hypothetical protein FJT64_010453 [Amphibalanus amphitrite]
MRTSWPLSVTLALVAAASSSAALVAGGLGLGTGLAGLVGLQLVALTAGLIGAYIGSRKFGRGGGFHHGHSYGGYGEYSSYGGGYDGHHRRRRAVAAPAPLYRFLEQAAAGDSLSCGLRLLCGLEADEYSQLAHDERLTHSVFRC